MAGKLDLVIHKGATFRKTFIYKDSSNTPINLTGYTARMQCRKSYQATSTIFDLTTENSGITLVEVEGEIQLFISDTDTSAITAVKGVYDLELITATADVVKLIRGTVQFIEEITQ